MPNTNSINVGDVQRVWARNIVNVADVVTDPTTLTLSVRKPGGSVTTYTYDPLSGIIIRESAGNYHADLPLDTAGWWRFDWHGTGAATFAEGSRFEVLPLNTDGIS